jgi:cytidylate kinase
MDSREPARHIAETWIRASAHPQRRRPAKPPPPAFTIAFSRETGSGGLLVAREVGKRLNWPVYDHELLEHLAKELHVDVDRLEAVDERPGSWLVESLNAFAAVSTVTEVTYFRRLLNLLLTLGARGECIIVGRGAPFVLPVETTLRVRLLASRPDRIALIGRERGLNPTEAARYVETTDRERFRFIKDHYHKDPTDSQLYDLVLNASRFSVEECAEIIIAALQRLQVRNALVPSGRPPDLRPA